ncbi:ParB/RepB/Spo0J family partition protein [Pseudooceanicola sp. CBS1P-1]|uniref:Chromosome partitioning protein ParB n=1 Tax=Pseudooceanicola albus TaxID=2692189 RepID=A0A6L7G4K6_9RHOB|nr:MULTISPECIES: ParB/RepB/Spo0J family partition protein [Pseudooceanicola]MBT9385362.1 ParB/RepB/Spo0J family partition protein [Pseudooceanicola endophyticus]MXN18779.1 chromosome partitioning protein ParB [Pseudooceanicola albus]
MAKRRKLEAPSVQDLNRLEEEFRRETPAEGGGRPRASLAAPIAQVAAEAASSHQPRPAEERAAQARDQRDAERLREAEGRGLVMLEIPLDEIDPDALVRDRVVLDAEEMQELQLSIAANGLRLPVEVFALAEGQGYRYGLLSGYRRLRAFQALKGGNPRAGTYDTIKAVLREPEAMGGTFAAMIEENEIRSGLSHFERGRIAVIASQQGAFVNVEAAVDGLFPMASKAKRSKIRSFALIFEELGDMLAFPDLIREKDGLKIAAALRNGAESALREALARRHAETPDEEAEMLTAALAEVTPSDPDPRKGGRPKKQPETRSVPLDSGIVLEYGPEGKGWTIRLKGRRLDRELVELAVSELERMLSRDR